MSKKILPAKLDKTSSLDRRIKLSLIPYTNNVIKTNIPEEKEMRKREAKKRWYYRQKALKRGIDVTTAQREFIKSLTKGDDIIITESDDESDDNYPLIIDTSKILTEKMDISNIDTIKINQDIIILQNMVH